MKRNKAGRKHGHSWVVKFLVFITVFATAYSLILPAVTLSAQETYCNQAEHIHSEECAENCEIKEHTHSDQCYSNPNADVETATDWMASLGSALTMETSPEKLVAIAQSQIGYHASAANYQISDDGAKIGYSRYGAWCNDPYLDDWNMAFVNFCLQHVPVDEMWNLPGDVQSAFELLLSRGLMKVAPSDIKSGDLVFFESDENLAAGIIESVDESSLTVISKVDNGVGQISLDKNSLSGQVCSPITVSDNQIDTILKNRMNEPLEDQTEELQSSKDISVQAGENPQPNESCDFTQPFPSDVITGKRLVYKTAAMTDWVAYSGQPITDDGAMIAVEVLYDKLEKSTVEADNGQYFLEIPELFQSIEDSETGSAMKHTNRTGTDVNEVEIGRIKSCASNPGHVHIHYDKIDNVKGDVIDNGKIYLVCSIDFDKYYVDKNNKVTIGDNEITLNIDETYYERNAKPVNLTKNGSPSNNVNDYVHRLENGKLQIDYVVNFNSGEKPIPDAILEDYMDWNREVIEILPDSVKIKVGDNGTEEAVKENPKFKFVSNTNTKGDHDQTTYKDLIYEDHFGNQQTHKVRGPGFAVYIGDLEPNTNCTLKYSIIADTTKMPGNPNPNRSRDFYNIVNLFSNNTNKLSATHTVSTKAYLSVDKETLGLKENQQGDLILSYSVKVSAPDSNTYAFLDVDLTDTMKCVKEETAAILSQFNENINIVDGSIKVLKGNVSSYDELTDDNKININDFNLTKDSTGVMGTFHLGTMNPGDKALITYQVKLDKAIKENLTINSTGGFDFKNEAKIIRQSELYPSSDDIYTVTDSTSDRIDAYALATKQKLDQVTETATEIQTNGNKIYDENRNETQVSGFTVPAGSIIYTIQLNEDGFGNFMNAVFTDRLSTASGETQDTFGYTGYAEVKMFSGAQKDGNAEIGTVFIKLPEGADQFSFKPNDYDEIQRLNNQLPTGTNLSFQMTYYVKPKKASGGLVLNNTVQGTGIGVPGSTATIGVRTEASGWSSGTFNMALKKVGLTVSDPEEKEEGYPYGKLVWIIQLNGTSIPKGMVINDELQNPSIANGASAYFREDAIIGVYKTIEEFNDGSVPFTGFDHLQVGVNNRDPDIYRKVMEKLNGSEIDKSSYTLTRTGNQQRPTGFQLVFNKDVILGQNEKAYVVLQSAVSVNDASKWHYNRDQWGVTFNNTVSYNLENQSPMGQVQGSLEIRNRYLYRKAWGEVFSWKNNAIDQVFSRNETPDVKDSETTFGPYTKENVIDPVLNQMLSNVSPKLNDGSVLVDWRIQSRSDTGSPYNGVFEFVDNLDPELQYVSSFLTKDSMVNGTASVEVLGPDSQIEIENVEVTSNEDGGQKIRITVSGVANTSNFTIHLISKFKKDFAGLLDNLPQSEKWIVGNTVKIFNHGNQVGYGEDTAEMNFDRALDKKTIAKENLSQDEKEKLGLNGLKYEILFNQDGWDLIPGNDTVTLKDTCNSNILVPDVDSIEILNTRENQKLDSSQYNISLSDVDPQTGNRTMFISNLPDETPLKITYNARVNSPLSGAIEVGNSVSWEGLGLGSTTPSETYTMSFSSNAAASSGSEANEIIKIKKVDQDNTSIKLEGAEFTIQPVGTDLQPIENQYFPLIVTTDAKGEIATDEHLTFNQMYKIVETKAPAGYVLDSTEYYFYFRKPVDDNEKEHGFQSPDWFPKKNLFLRANGTVLQMQFTNHKPRFSIDIEKFFNNQNVIPGKYLFGVYDKQHDAENSKLLRTVTLDIAEGTHAKSSKITIDNLVAEGSYYIYELDPVTKLPLDNQAYFVSDGQKYQVVYPAENGNEVAAGNIEEGSTVNFPVNNKPQYTLPHTGGSGTASIYLSGFGLLAVGGWMALRRRKNV